MLSRYIVIFLGWINATPHTGSDAIVLCKIVLRTTSLGEELFFNLRINADFSWILLLLGKYINPATTTYLKQCPQLTMSVADVEKIIQKIDCSQVCIGNGDEKFSNLVKKNEGKFKNMLGNLIS